MLPEKAVHSLGEGRRGFGTSERWEGEQAPHASADASESWSRLIRVVRGVRGEWLREERTERKEERGRE